MPLSQAHCSPQLYMHTLIGYALDNVGQKRRNAPPLTHDHAAPRFQA
jgi:hypothetical protein